MIGQAQEGAMRYLVIIERGEENYGAYVPDLPGCVAVGDTVEEVTQLIQEAMSFHLEGLCLNGEPIPTPMSQALEVEVEGHAA
jgi:predicted RNase H-like HicB family nuclease